MRRAEETRACHFHCSSPICTTLLWWLSHTHTHTLEVTGMPPTKPDVTYTLWPVNGTLNQIAFCLVRRKLLQICMATSNPGRAAWPCRCLKHQSEERIQPTRLTTAPAAFSYRPTRAKMLPLTGALFLWISSFKGTGIIPLHVKLFHTNLGGCYLHVFSRAYSIFHLLSGVGSCLAAHYRNER